MATWTQLAMVVGVAATAGAAHAGEPAPGKSWGDAEDPWNRGLTAGAVSLGIGAADAGLWRGRCFEDVFDSGEATVSRVCGPLAIATILAAVGYGLGTVHEVADAPYAVRRHRRRQTPALQLAPAMVRSSDGGHTTVLPLVGRF
jgi:hypothetical protein